MDPDYQARYALDNDDEDYLDDDFTIDPYEDYPFFYELNTEEWDKYRLWLD